MRLWNILLLMTATMNTFAWVPQEDLKDFDRLMNYNRYGTGEFFSPQDVEEMELFKACYLRGLKFFSKEEERQIPLVLHWIWLGPKPYPKSSIENLKSWRRQHPNWKMLFWTDNIENKSFPIEGLELRSISEIDLGSLAPLFTATQNWAEKADLLRYVILYKMGGVYIDHDVHCFRSFSFLNRYLKLYAFLEIPHYLPGYPTAALVNNGLFGAIAAHPVLQETIEQIPLAWEKVEKKKSQFKTDFQKVIHRTFLPFTQSILNHLKKVKDEAMCLENGSDEGKLEDRLKMLIFPATCLYPLDYSAIELKERIDKDVCWAFHTQASTWLQAPNDGKKLEDIFVQIYRDKVWGELDDLSGSSGPGSTVSEAKPFLDFLNQFLASHSEIIRVVDIGCGDGEIFRNFNWGSRCYTGIDIVPDVIVRNRELYKKENTDFLCANCLEYDLPQGDLAICKDVLSHLSLKNIDILLKKLEQFRYVIFVTDLKNKEVHVTVNADISDGGFRCMRLGDSPFFLKSLACVSYPTDTGEKEIFVCEAKKSLLE